MTNINRHKHADLIHAWADGAIIQVKCDDNNWNDTDNPSWFASNEYRIKPKTKTIRFRNYLNCNDELKIQYHGYPDYCNSKWIGEWQEVEIDD